MPNNIVQIKKVKTGYRVKYYAANGELLANSEVLTSTANGRKNIKAMVKLMQSGFSIVS